MLSARQDLVKRGHRLRSAPLMEVSCIHDSRMYTRAARNAYTRARMLAGAACYTEVLYRLTVGNRREAEESLSGAAAWLWLSYIINLSLSASLPLPRIPVLSPPPSLSLSLSLSLFLSASRSLMAHPGGCLPLLLVVSLLTHLIPSELCLPLLLRSTCHIRVRRVSQVLRAASALQRESRVTTAERDSTSACSLGLSSVPSGDTSSCVAYLASQRYHP